MLRCGGLPQRKFPGWRLRPLGTWNDLGIPDRRIAGGGAATAICARKCRALDRPRIRERPRPSARPFAYSLRLASRATVLAAATFGSRRRCTVRRRPRPPRRDLKRRFNMTFPPFHWRVNGWLQPLFRRARSRFAVASHVGAYPPHPIPARRIGPLIGVRRRSQASPPVRGDFFLQSPRPGVMRHVLRRPLSIPCPVNAGISELDQGTFCHAVAIPRTDDQTTGDITWPTAL